MLLWRAVKSGKSGAKCPLKEPSPAIAGRLSAPGTDRWRRRLRGGYVRRVGAGVSGSKSPVTPRGERKPGKNLYRTSRQFKQCNLPQKSIVGMARPPFTVWLDGHCLPWPSRLAVHARHETPGGATKASATEDSNHRDHWPTRLHIEPLIPCARLISAATSLPTPRREPTLPSLTSA